MTLTAASMTRQVADLLMDGYGVEDVAVRLGLPADEMGRWVGRAASLMPALDHHRAVARRFAKEARECCRIRLSPTLPTASTASPLNTPKPRSSTSPPRPAATARTAC